LVDKVHRIFKAYIEEQGALQQLIREFFLYFNDVAGTEVNPDIYFKNTSFPMKLQK